MTMKMGMVKTEMKPTDDYVSLQWGKCKRPRFCKAGAVQIGLQSDVACRPDGRSTHPLTYLQPKSASTQAIPAKGDTENSCIDHQSPSSEKPGNECVLVEKDINKNRSSPSRNGHCRRRTELESLHDKHLLMRELKLAVSKWPKILISLSHKEKEDDFMAIKGSKLPQRPRKRAKHVEKFVTVNFFTSSVFGVLILFSLDHLTGHTSVFCVKQYISPGAWLCEVSLDRYEVREKNCLRRKPAGLRAMESMDMDSDSS